MCISETQSESQTFLIISCIPNLCRNPNLIGFIFIPLRLGDVHTFVFPYSQYFIYDVYLFQFQES